MIHLGILLLLVGEGITSGSQVERQMTIDEGSFTNYAQDIREVELASSTPRRPITMITRSFPPR
jgi:hypothetical protein